VASAVEADEHHTIRHRRPPAWLFGITSMPYGCFNGVIAVALPYLLRKNGLSVDRIASIGALVQLPAIWYFLWAPVVDLKFRRRTWVVSLSVVSGALTMLALSRDMSAYTRTITGMLIVASALNQPVSSAVGGLVAAVMPDALRGRTGGWSQAGMLGGGIIAGGSAVWLADHAPMAVLAAVVGLLIAAPGAAALTIDEPLGDRHALREDPGRMFRELWAAVRRREVWIGFLFFLTPIGAGALMNLFTAVATDFRARPDMVIWVVAIAGLLTPTGALIGGFVCDRVSRWIVYPIGGLVAAASAGLMLWLPLVPASYAIGAAAYALATGFCYAAFMALAFELLGEGAATSGTQFTLFMAATNVPVAYMIRLDGMGHRWWGVRGMIAVDAVANGAFGVLLLAGVWAVRVRAARKKSG
jgi:PAT family beta-lactamase induction signal transducer AmpG